MAAFALALAGTVATPDGTPVSGARITVVGTVQSAVSSTDGTFSLEAALPVDLIVTADGFATRTVRVSTDSPVIVLYPRAIEASVLVTATSAPPGSISLSGDALSLAPALTTDERLRAISGFSLFRRSTSRQANPTTHGVTMRGLSASGASRGLVLLDGVPLNDGFGAWVTWTRVPPAALDRVDVLAGSVGDTFGSDALGGVIRLQSPVWNRPGASLTIEGGSFETFATDIAAGTSHRDLAWFGAASAVDSDGSVPLVPASAGAVDRAADVQWWNGFGRVELSRGLSRWSLFGFGGRDDRGNGTVMQRNRVAGGTGVAGYDTTRGATTLAARVSLSTNSLDQTFSAVAAGRATETLTSTQYIDADVLRGAVEVGRTARTWFAMGRASVARGSADFREIRAAGETAQSLVDDAESLSAHLSWMARSDVTVSAGGRAEWRRAPTDDLSRDFTRVGRIVAQWQPAARVRLHGSAATSHRWPTLNELVRGFRVGNAQTLPNPNLDPERATSFEAGATFEGAARRVGATFFHSVVHDAIANVTLPSQTGILRERRNAGDAVAKGFEVDGHLSVSRFVRLTGSLTWVDATFQRSAEPPIEGKRLPQVPEFSGAASAMVHLGSTAANLIIRSTGHQFDDDRNTFRLASATQLDATVSTRVRRARLFVTAENVLDARIETGRTPLVTLAPGRAIRAGVQVLLGDLRR